MKFKVVFYNVVLEQVDELMKAGIENTLLKPREQCVLKQSEWRMEII